MNMWNELHLRDMLTSDRLTREDKTALRWSLHVLADQRREIRRLEATIHAATAALYRRPMRFSR